ncbi:MAG TPA: pitrilysin family protein [Clostridia bacterium]|nr:pitrilysin family protein [Clostridia bacterium]
MKRLRALFAFLFTLTLLVPAQAQDLAAFEKRVTVRKLANGLTVIICRRPEAPVFSFTTLVDAGSVQDPRGKTGLAHMMEHMAFKGTHKIGTTDFSAEQPALERVEKTYAAYDSERQKVFGRDPKKLAQLEKEWRDAIAQADKYVIKNEFGEIVEREGGVGLNASTGYDETDYIYSMPANRTELWAYLESERFLHPVRREFYKERDVVIEERRMRTESSPIGRMVEQFLGTAFDASPYHRPGIGYLSDLQHFSANDAIEFFKTYYVPSNMIVSVAGDVDPDKIMPIIERYFSRVPSGPKPLEYVTRQPPQNSERVVNIKDPAQPFYIEGYHRPDYRDPDDAVYDAISDVMSNGRTSRLFRSLVRDKKIAAFAAGFSGFPGTKYPHLFAFYAVPLPNRSNQEVQSAIRAEIERLKTQDVSDDELKMFKTRARASLIRSLDSNPGLAGALATMQMRYGDWRELFRQLDRIEKVTKADIRRVANKTFVENNRTVGVIETMKPAAASKGAQAQ